MNAHELKLRDADIIRMNSVGLCQSTIASALGCHPTTVTQRLKFNNVLLLILVEDLWKILL
jgi:hypothetical protein